MKKILSLSLLSLFIVTNLAGCSNAQADDIEKSFKVKAGGTLVIDSDSGTIDIESHDKNTVEVRVEKSGSNSDEFEVTFSQRGSDVRVKGDRQGSFGWNGPKVRFTVKVPNKYNLDLETGGGSIDVSDLHGKIQANTSGGSIDIGQITGDVELKTSGGSIRVDQVAGNIDAHTSGGSVTAKITKQPTQNCRLKTSGGSVTAYLAKDIAVDLDASTSGGRVRSDFTVNGSVSKTSIEGKINGGGPDLVMKTSGGSVRIKEL